MVLSQMDHQERLQIRRFNNGTNGARQRPRVEAAPPVLKPRFSAVSEQEMAFIDGIVEGLPLEGTFPKDMGSKHLWAEGARIVLAVGKVIYVARVISAYEVFDRLRYRVEFACNGVQMSFTQAQMLALKPTRKPDIAPAVEKAIADVLEIASIKRGSRRVDVRRRQNYQ